MLLGMIRLGEDTESCKLLTIFAQDLNSTSVKGSFREAWHAATAGRTMRERIENSFRTGKSTKLRLRLTQSVLQMATQCYNAVRSGIEAGARDRT